MHASSNGGTTNASQVPTRDGLVLVAGGTGFIGSAIVRALAPARPIAVLTRDASRARERFEDSRLEVDARQGDVTDPDSLADLLADVDTVVQCVQFAGFPVESPSRGLTFMDVDAAGTEALVSAAREQGVRKVVYLSGVGADANAARPWFRAKGLAEESVRSSGLAFAIVRPSWTYGPGDSSLNRFVDILRILPGFFPQLGPGDQRINPVFIDDVARLVAEVVTEDAADGKIIEVGGPEILTLDDIIRVTMRAVGREKPILHLPLGLARLGGSLLELLPGQLLSEGAVEFVAQSAVADLGTLRSLFPGLSGRPLGQALATYL